MTNDGSRVSARTWGLGAATWMSVAGAAALFPYPFIGCLGALLGLVSLFFGVGFLHCMERDVRRFSRWNPSGFILLILGTVWTMLAGFASCGLIDLRSGAVNGGYLPGLLVSWVFGPGIFVGGLRLLGETSVGSLILNGTAAAALGPATAALCLVLRSSGWPTTA